jgi:hypothetical protein
MNETMADLGSILMQSPMQAIEQTPLKTPLKTLMHTEGKTSTHMPKTLNSINKWNHNVGGGGEKNVGNVGAKHKYLFAYKTMDEAMEWKTQKLVDLIQ